MAGVEEGLQAEGLSGGAIWPCSVMKRELNFDCRLSDYLLGRVTNHRFMSAV